MKKLVETINGLEQYRDAGWTGINDYYRPFVADALELLKAKEQKPISASIVDSDGGLMHWWACGNCQEPINPEDKFCRECGQAVKWE